MDAKSTSREIKIISNIYWKSNFCAMIMRKYKLSLIMNLPPQKFREIVFQILYAFDFTDLIEDEILEMVMKLCKISKKNAKACYEKSLIIFEKLQEIDPIIAGSSPSYEFQRISSVEKNILRLTLFEMLFEEDMPEKVCISEGIRLAKKFSTTESTAFVNAVLDNIYKTRLAVAH
ncbi:MAG: transcription antitermination factor NusB [Chlamydiota bacterium]